MQQKLPRPWDMRDGTKIPPEDETSSHIFKNTPHDTHGPFLVTTGGYGRGSGRS